MASAYSGLPPGTTGGAFRRAIDARNPTAPRVYRHGVKIRVRTGAVKRSGRPSIPWTPSRQRRLLRLWLCAHDLNMTQICELLEEDGFNPKATATYEQLNTLLSVLEDKPAVLRPDNRAAMRTRMRILRLARTKPMGHRRATATTRASNISATWRQSMVNSDAWDPPRPGGTGNLQLVAGIDSAAAATTISAADRPARASFLNRHSAATCRLVLQVARSSRTSSWLGDVASLLSGLTRASSTATHRSATSTWTKRISSTTAPELGPRLSEDSLPSRSPSDQKLDTPTQVATFLSNKAVVAKCCAAGGRARLCAHQRLRHVIRTVLPCGQRPGQAKTPFTVTKLEANTPDTLGNTLLHVAATWGAPISVLVDILECADNVSTINNNGETFLHVFEPCPATTTAAAFNGLVSYLYKRGFPFCQLDAEQRTCLSRLVTRPSFPLGALSAFVELPANMGRFFLEHKSLRGERLHHAICRRLNDQRLAVPQDDDGDGDDAEASLARRICAGGASLERGLESRPLSPPPRSPSPHDTEPDDFLRCLINDDYDVNYQASRTGRTPLMMLLARLQPGQQLRGKAELALARLLYLGAKLDLRDHRGETALHYAVRLGLPSVVALLCAHDADVNATNDRSLTPFHLAQLGIRDPRDLLPSPRMAVRFMQCATILAEYAAVQAPPPPMQ